MDPFNYQRGVLRAENVALEEIADAVGTPFFCYSASAIAAQYRAYQQAFADQDALICYAMKANGNLAVIKTLGDLGAGADIVSIGEMHRALAAGIPSERIVFAGVGKTPEEMSDALAAGVFQFNVESEPELEALNTVALKAGRKAPISIRVNPDVDAKTHAHITTGRRQDKFGIPWDRVGEIYEKAAKAEGLDVMGVAVHIGSQIGDVEPMGEAFRRMLTLARELKADGQNIRRLDFGGGLGIVYEDEKAPDLNAYAAMVKDVVGDFTAKLIFEPGRFLVGNAGVMVSKVIYVKEEGRRFIILDSAMNDLIRPALYGAWHDFVPLKEAATDAAIEPADLVGPICESTDRFAEQRLMPPLEAGDLIAAKSAGAYCAVMSSNYNARPLVAEVMVKDDVFAVVRSRQTVEELIAAERLPDWA
jgi:diaminopimelate decarboxylase